MTEEVQLESAVVAALYEEHAAELRRFLYGVLRDEALAGDVVQTTFVRLMEVGRKTQAETRKAWLFRVAYNEALAWRRREAAGERALEKRTFQRMGDLPATSDPLVSRETQEQIQQALTELPPEQAQLVRKRIYEEKTFAEIASELDIPLGTALARMRAALKKLRLKLPGAEDVEVKSEPGESSVEE